MHMTTDQIARLAIECSKYNAHVVEVNPCALRSRDVRAEFSDDQGNAIFGVTIEQDGEVDGVSLAAAEYDAREPVTPDDRWNDNAIQFPRLLAEIAATVDLSPEQWGELLASMDIETAELSELFDRAQTAWEEQVRALDA